MAFFTSNSRYLSTEHPGANFIYDLTDDSKGSLWLTTDHGLIQFTPDTGELATPTTGRYRQILPFHDIFPYRIYRNRAGYIFVGGAFQSGKGYYRFHPDNIPYNNHIPPIILTAFSVNTSPFYPDTLITHKKHVFLKYNQNFFSLECAALDYNDPTKNQYAHYLEGLEEDWIYTRHNRLANYTDVPPGSYIFHAKGTNNDGYWNETGANLAITILPPPWKTWWAYVLYGLFILGTSYMVVRFFLKRLQLSHTLELEHVEKEKLKELDQLKSRFFANISHEFRTPLTLILGPLEKFRSKVSDKEGISDLNIIQRNALRLQNLINQLLSLSKLESGQMKLQVEEKDAIHLIKGYVKSFESLAKQKGIQLVFTAQRDDILFWIDQDKLEKILFNLLSNAFKYTSSGGKIEVKVFRSSGSQVIGNANSTRPTDLLTRRHQELDDYLGIQISDTGAGIPPKKLPHIFDRFYQADETYTRDSEGTGIGLALTRELIELHHGRIEVKSEVGEGTIFTVHLPLGDEHFTEEEKRERRKEEKVDSLRLMDDGGIVITEPRTLDFEPGTSDDKPLILIVEDNPDLLQYMQCYLDQAYKIIKAEDGKQGLEMAIDKIPDLIISDVMMPTMDGLEMCKKLKTDEKTSHIPIVLLTARADIEDRLEGLETGADDYITKPFNSRELLVRIKNLLELRKNLRDQFMKESEKSDLSTLMKFPEAGISSMEQKFLLRAVGILNANFSDPGFTVKRFCAEMAMSNMQLHRKLVAVTGQTANSFIRYYRLKRAAQLLEKRAGTVSEIAFEVGFNNLSWFARCFKEQFGVNPSEYTSKQDLK